MKSIGFDREEEAEEWVRKKLNLTEKPDFFRAFSTVDENDEFVCVAVMTNFSSVNVDMNIAMENKKIRPKAMIKMFNDVFSFLFNQLYVSRVTGLTNNENKKAQKIIEHFGFNLEGVMRKAANGKDLMIYGFLAEDYNNHAWNVK